MSKQQALKSLSDYYQQNKQWLPPTIVKYRDQILQQILKGFTVEQAVKNILQI